MQGPEEPREGAEQAGSGEQASQRRGGHPAWPTLPAPCVAPRVRPRPRRPAPALPLSRPLPSARPPLCANRAAPSPPVARGRRGRCQGLPECLTRLAPSGAVLLPTPLARPPRASVHPLPPAARLVSQVRWTLRSLHLASSAGGLAAGSWLPGPAMPTRSRRPPRRRRCTTC